MLKLLLVNACNGVFALERGPCLHSKVGIEGEKEAQVVLRVCCWALGHHREAWWGVAGQSVHRFLMHAQLLAPYRTIKKQLGVTNTKTN